MLIERLISYKDANCDFGHLPGSCGGSVMVSDAEAGATSLFSQLSYCLLSLLLAAPTSKLYQPCRIHIK